MISEYILLQGIQNLRQGNVKQSQRYLWLFEGLLRCEFIAKQGRSYYRLAKCYVKLQDISGIDRTFFNCIRLLERDQFERLKRHCKPELLKLYYMRKHRSVYTLFKRLFSVFSADAEICLYYGFAEMEINHNYERGKQIIDRAFNCQTEDISWLYVGKGAMLYDHCQLKEEGLELIKKGVELKRSCRNLLSYAHRLAEKDYKTAHKLYLELYRNKQIDHYEVLSGLAETYTRSGNLDMGQQFGLRAYEANPKDAKTAAWLGYLYFQREDYKRSLYFYKRALDEYNRPYIYKSMAACYEKLGHPIKAKLLYCQAETAKRGIAT